MSNTSALEVRIQAVLPESISSGVMLLLSVTGLEINETPSGGWILGRPKICKTLLALCCAKRAFGYTRVTVAMRM
jgi:hypothetical protein